MLDWFKNLNKEYPYFWKEYIAKFSRKSNRYVIMYLDATGANPELDVITFLSAFSVVDNNILIGDSFETILLQYKYLHDNQLSNEYIIESQMQKLGEPDALKSFIEYIGNAVLVGHQIEKDVELINAALERLGCGKLKNEALDIEIMQQKLIDDTDKHFEIDDLSDLYHLPLDLGSSSTEKAFKLALVFLKIKTKLGLR